MSVDTTVPVVDEHLGGSVIYEEHKGNFAEARRVVEEHLEAARRGNDPVELADALLARGIVHLLQGEPPAALECLTRIETLVHDPERRLRAAAYANLAAQLRFNTFPNGSGADGTEIQALKGELWDRLAQFNQTRSAVEGRVTDPAIRLETRLVYGLLRDVPDARSLLGYVRSSTEERTEQLLNQALQAPLTFRQQAEDLGADPALTAYADLVSADLYFRAGQHGTAWEFLQQASAGYRQAGDRVGLATCGVILGDWLGAPFSTPLVTNFAIQDSGQQGSDLGWTLESVEFDRGGADIDGARAAYGEAEKLFAEANAPRGLAAVQLRRGYLAQLNGEYNAATGYYRQAQEGFRACGDRLGYWLARTHHSLSLVGADQLPEELAAAREIGSWGATEGSFSYALGLGLLFSRAGRFWLTREGDYERALACHRLAGALFEELGVPHNAAQSLVDRGDVYKTIGEPTAAVVAYEQARDLLTQVMSSRPSTAATAWSQAVLTGVKIYQTHLECMDPEGIERATARTEDLVAQSPVPDTGASGTTMEQLVASVLRESVRSQVAPGKILVPLYRAVQAQEAGNEDVAEAQFELALTGARSLGNDERHLMEAVVLGHRRSYPEAAAAYRRYLERNGGGLVESLEGLVANFGERGTAEARLKRERTHEQAATFFTRMRAYADAKTYLDALEQSSGPEWWSRIERPWQSLSDYGEVHEGMGELQQALAYYARAIAALEERRGLLSRDELKTALAGTLDAQYLYFHASRTAIKLREEASLAGDKEQAGIHAAEAFDYAERGKARGLLDLMAGSAVTAGSSKAQSQTLSAWRQLNARLTTWRGLLARSRTQNEHEPDHIRHFEHQIEATEARLRRVESDLATTNPHFYRTANPQAQVSSVEEVSAALAPDTALLQYYYLGEDLLAWAITPEGLVQTHRARVDARTLNRWIRDFHRACKERETAEDPGFRLAETLLAPFEETIQNSSRLIIVPYGTAHLLPFHVLPWEGVPLISTRALSYLPSASTLRFLNHAEARPLPERLLAVGNPSNMAHRSPLGGAPVPHNDLPWASTEAAYVASLYSDGRALCGSAATESAVLREIPTYPLLHFATHGLLSEEAPLLSSILLAEGEALSLYELLGMRLNADLVVLSACDTGVGETTGGDDVLGMTRGLLGAGADAAIVSLWPVSDSATSLLMGRLYRRLRAGDAPPVALQAAQNYLRTLSREEIQAELGQLKRELKEAGSYGAARSVDEVVTTPDATTRFAGPTKQTSSGPEGYSHPYYWAPFVFVGR